MPILVVVLCIVKNVSTSSTCRFFYAYKFKELIGHNLYTSPYCTNKLFHSRQFLPERYVAQT